MNPIDSCGYVAAHQKRLLTAPTSHGPVCDVLNAHDFHQMMQAKRQFPWCVRGEA